MQADMVISTPWIVPVVPSGTILENHAIAVSDQRIVAIAPRAEITDHFQTSQTVELRHHVLIPGLVNAHGHSAMVLFRGIVEDIPLKQWLEDCIWPLESRYVSPGFVRDGALLAIAEMIAGGTTCFADMYFHPEEVATAAIRGGMRAQLACPVLEFEHSWARDAQESIRKISRLHEQYRGNELVEIALGPHAPYSVADRSMQAIARLGDEMDVPIHIHVHETAGEIEDALATDGRRPLERMADLGLIGPRLVAVHATQLNDREMEMLAENRSSVIHCPASNLKLASGLCEVEKLRQAGVNVGLGCDGAASNNDLDMFAELQLAAMVGKTVAGDPQAVPASYALEMATINSARALGMDRDIGSLEAGKLADMAAVNLDRLSTLPVNNVISQLAFAVQAHQVSHVWCGGRALLQDGKLETLDLQEIRQLAHRWQQIFRQDQALSW